MSQPPPAAPAPFTLDDQTLIYLRALSARYPNIDATLAALASLHATLTLPKGTIHVISDVHGEFKKLLHVINNASGSLRPLVEQTFGPRLSAGEKLDLLNLIYYPRETYPLLSERLPDDASKRHFLRRQARLELELLRRISRPYSLEGIEHVFPVNYKPLLRELLFGAYLERSDDYVNALLDQYVLQGEELPFLRTLARVIRNLLFSELIVAGDFGDRGPRIDKVIDYVMRQPNVSIVWGNHDVSWMGACLGQDACIATVLRMSLRYQRLFQLEMGYGIPMAPLEKLVRKVYYDDRAEWFPCLGSGIRDALTMSRMQKAMAIIQFKLESQTIQRNPDFDLDHRRLLHRVYPDEGTINLDGKVYALRDLYFPTIDWSDPYTLSPEEKECLDQLRVSFLASQTLWEQMRFLERKGRMHLVRDYNLIFHGCIPVNAAGEFLPFKVKGTEYRGRALFEALDTAIHHAFRDRDPANLDLLWYLWCGPLSPLFGKDKIATFESYFIADKAAHHETKNPYFRLINEKGFCRGVLRDFGVDEAHGLIVNGHVPVKIEQGESPIKASGQAITIDGAFSEVYGDNGFTLVLDADRTYLAQHHHFESVADAITRGADIVPTIQAVPSSTRRAASATPSRVTPSAARSPRSKPSCAPTAKTSSPSVWIEGPAPRLSASPAPARTAPPPRRSPPGPGRSLSTRSQRALIAVTTSVPPVCQSPAVRSVANCTAYVNPDSLPVVRRTNSTVNRRPPALTVSNRTSGSPRTPVPATITAGSANVGSRLNGKLQ